MQTVGTCTNNHTTSRCFSLKTDAEVLQWNQFSNSEIQPFIIGLLSNFEQRPTRSVDNSHGIHSLMDHLIWDLYVYIYIYKAYPTLIFNFYD